MKYLVIRVRMLRVNTVSAGSWMLQISGNISEDRTVVRILM